MEYREYLSEAHRISKSGDVVGLRKVKVAVLPSFTLDFLEPVFKVEAFHGQFQLELQWGGFNQYAQEILDPTSQFYAFNPDLIILAVRLEELYPAVSDDYLTVLADCQQVADTVISQLENLLQTIRARTNSSLLLHNFIVPPHPCCSLFDFQNPGGMVNLIRKLNLSLVELAGKYPGVYLVDLEHLAGLFGKQTIFDRKMWYVAGNPYKVSFYQLLAKEYLKYLKAIYGLQKKCIVLDLDNTLWGGLAGEDGIDGIQLNDNYPGRCYRDFQRELLNLNKRGVLLAVNSKNNFADAMEIIQQHPEMILKEEHFVCFKINWNNKASNLREIAAELNIGLDSLVFIDDSRAECELVRQKLPEVTTIQLPDNPLAYVELLRELDLFETLSITEESLKKTRIYQAQLERSKLAEQFENLTDYYRSLAMVVTVQAVNELLVPRVAELTQKTNQFNLTTIRYTQDEIRQLLQRPDYLLYALKVSDRFGDNGTVGLCIIHKVSQAEWDIETLLLSCRVMNRTVENAFLAFIAEKARANQVERLIGHYRPTKKNGPVQHLYEDLGFLRQEDCYILEVNQTFLKCPEYLTLVADA